MRLDRSMGSNLNITLIFLKLLIVFPSQIPHLQNLQTTDFLDGIGRVYFLDPNGHIFEVVA
jgi:hypothetical protein